MSEEKELEARGGIEPPIMVLQTIALPLGDRATEPKETWNGEGRGEGGPRRPVSWLEQKVPPLCSASCGDGLLLTGASFVDDGRTDEVAPFGPRTVVVTNVTVAQEILQDEPGVRTALTDAAVGDDLVLAGNAFRLVELLQVV